MKSLTRIVPWSQQLITEVLAPGNLAVDLTAGKGRDTLVLARAVGPTGRVVAFDLQKDALEQAARTLAANGFTPCIWANGAMIPDSPGIYLVHACHASFSKVLQGACKGVIANLGYLPGGDKHLITRSETTLSAVGQALDRLAPGGRLAVTAYPAHPGGGEEGEAVLALFMALPADSWQVLQIAVTNRSDAPYLMVAERRSHHHAPQHVLKNS